MIDLKIVIPDDVYQKIMWWVNKSNHEVSGFGSVDFDPATGVFTVRDAILLKQEVGPTSTEIDPVAIGKAMFEMRNEPNALKWHWHSHVDMGVFWSADDRALIKNLGSQGWIVASVFNKKREIKSAFYTNVEIGIMGMVKKQELFLEDVTTNVQRYIAANLCNEWDKSYDEHVKPIVHKTFHSYGWKDKNPKKGFVDNAVRVITDRNPKAPNSYDVDSEGIRWSHRYEKWVYNPFFDKSLTTQREILEMIRTMDDDEVDAALTYFGDKTSGFEKLYDIVVAEEFAKIKNDDEQLLIGIAP